MLIAILLNDLADMNPGTWRIGKKTRKTKKLSQAKTYNPMLSGIPIEN